MSRWRVAHPFRRVYPRCLRERIECDPALLVEIGGTRSHVYRGRRRFVHARLSRNGRVRSNPYSPSLPNYKECPGVRNSSSSDSLSSSFFEDLPKFREGLVPVSVGGDYSGLYRSLR